MKVNTEKDKRLKLAAAEKNRNEKENDIKEKLSEIKINRKVQKRNSDNFSSDVDAGSF